MLIDRRGKVHLVLAGNAERILIPALGSGNSQGRLRGLRLLHTHLSDEGLSQEDLMDLLFLRLDAMAVLCVGDEGQPRYVQYAQLDPARQDPPYQLSPLLPWDNSRINLGSSALEIESELARRDQGRAITGRQRAILVSVSTLPHLEQERNLDELAQLAQTAGVIPCDRMLQRCRREDNRSIVGKGKLAELEVLALKHNADTLIFDGELSPAQLHTLADLTERKVLDRTQLILDIFAQHAKSRAGKLQVELAQLRYLQPRLAGKNKAMDRLMGGIGGKGPGETRLETDRRKNRERIAFLKKELEKIVQQRTYVRTRRKRNGLPLAALVGYTNAGKSTLLNTLSRSHVLTADKLFATLDPVTRRLRFPTSQEIVFADTIGFIRNLPGELVEAFRATLDELHDADLLIHVVDAADPNLVQHMQSVHDILEDLGLSELTTLLVFNKWDRLDPERQDDLINAFPEALPLSAVSHFGLRELEERIVQVFFTRYPPK